MPNHKQPDALYQTRTNMPSLKQETKRTFHFPAPRLYEVWLDSSPNGKHDDAFGKLHRLLNKHESKLKSYDKTDGVCLIEAYDSAINALNTSEGIVETLAIPGTPKAILQAGKVITHEDTLKVGLTR